MSGKALAAGSGEMQNPRLAPCGSQIRSRHLIRFQPKPGSDLTKVIFAEFKWATNKPDAVPQPKANDR